MALDPKTPAGGGCLVLVGFLIGSAVGIARGEPSLGVLIGVGAGALLALIFWLLGRRSRG